jgi:hypothetical protein
MSSFVLGVTHSLSFPSGIPIAQTSVSSHYLNSLFLSWLGACQHGVAPPCSVHQGVIKGSSRGQCVKGSVCN